MATRKPKAAPLSVFKRVKNAVTDERLPKIFGLFCYLIALFLFISFTSYLFTWTKDQDKIMPFKWDHMFDRELVVTNWFGKLGALVSHGFFYWGFGLASFAIIFLFIRIGYRLINGSGSARIWPMLRNVVFFMVLGCTFFELILPEASFSFSGAYGRSIVSWSTDYVGRTGTWMFFIFILLGLGVWFKNMNPDMVSFKKYFPEFNRKMFNFLSVSKLLENLKRHEEEYEMPVDVSKSNQLEMEEMKAEETGTTIHLDNGFEAITATVPEPNNQIPGNEVPFELESNNENTDTKITTQNNDGNHDFEIEDTSTAFINQNDPEQEPHINELSPEEEELLQVRATLDNEDEPYNPILELSKYEHPPLDLLDSFDDQQVKIDHEVLKTNKDQIVNTLLNYKIEITKIRATVGPTVTLYEIVPAPGVRISKIKNLEDDIALSLAALGIRIIAPIPGRGTIGIEVPNQNKQIVGLKEMLLSERFRAANMDLPIAFGRTISNEVFVADLTRMPHLLIAGATGQGKSVGINSILVSIIQHNHPAYVKLVLIDPKKVELSIYSKLEHHFLCMLPDQEDPIITDTKKVIRTLNSLVIEMDSRYDLLKKAGVRNIKEYNQKFTDRKLNPKKGHKFLPFIVLVIDEFADLIMTAGKEIEGPIARIAQLARAIGIHLVIATQRPSVKIITGIIKANFPARIAFKVSSKIDSGIILDAGGADQLIGRGDMLLSADGKIVRIQSAFVDTHEIDKIVNFIADQQGFPTPYMLPDVPEESGEGGSKGALKLSDLDDMIQEAALLVVANQHGSTSMIQRRLKLGYNRAGRIMDQMESLGIVGPSEGSKPREVLFHSEMEVNTFFDNLNENAF